MTRALAAALPIVGILIGLSSAQFLRNSVVQARSQSGLYTLLACKH
jgi:hypothetical protein